MKNTIVLLALTLTASFSHAISSSEVSTLVNSAEFKALEAAASDQKLELDSITDTGNRYRCPCSDVIVVFKNDEGKTSQKTVRIESGRVTIVK